MNCWTLKDPFSWEVDEEVEGGLCYRPGTDKKWWSNIKKGQRDTVKDAERRDNPDANNASPDEDIFYSRGADHCLLL
jgi:hypothetical protein